MKKSFKINKEKDRGKALKSKKEDHEKNNVLEKEIVKKTNVMKNREESDLRGEGMRMVANHLTMIVKIKMLTEDIEVEIDLRVEEVKIDMEGRIGLIERLSVIAITAVIARVSIDIIEAMKDVLPRKREERKSKKRKCKKRRI